MAKQQNKDYEAVISGLAQPKNILSPNSTFQR